MIHNVHDQIGSVPLTSDHPHVKAKASATHVAHSRRSQTIGTTRTNTADARISTSRAVVDTTATTPPLVSVALSGPKAARVAPKATTAASRPS